MSYFNIGDAVIKSEDSKVGKIVEINDAGRLRIYWSHRINREGLVVALPDPKRTWMQPTAVGRWIEAINGKFPESSK